MPAEVGAFIIGDERLIFNLRATDRIVEEELYRAALTASLWIEQSANLHVPKRTGNLARAIFTRVRRFRRRFEVEVGVSEGAPYGVYVEKGTGIYGDYHRPFIVRRGAGSYVHQGMRARPFISPSIDENAPRIEALYESVGNRVARRLST